MKLLEIKGVMFDFDGVLVNTAEAFCETAAALTNTRLLVEDITTIDLSLCTGFSKETIDYMFSHPLLFSKLKLYPDAIALIKKVKALGIETRILTHSKSYQTAKSKLVWWELNQPFMIDRPDVFINDVREQQSKSGYDMTGYIYIEDTPHHLIESNASVKILVNRPYNLSHTGDFIRVDLSNLYDTVSSIIMGGSGAGV